MVIVERVFFFTFVMNRISFNLYYGHNIVINITPVGQSETLISNGSYIEACVHVYYYMHIL